MNVKPSQAGKIADMRLGGASVAETAQAFGVTGRYVSYCTRGMAVPKRRKVRAETVMTAKERVQAELDAGTRCRVCWLLLPCYDHQP